MNAIATNAARSADGASEDDGALRAESIGKTYPARGRELVILHDVSMTMSAGDSAVVMGPSGSGKSTLLNILGTLEPPTSGRVTIGGMDPFTFDERGLARFRNRTIGFIFQEHHLLPQCTVLENVLLPTLAGPPEGDVSALDRAKQLLDRVGLSDRLDHRPSELSGGERQRVAIARALINRPGVLLADEPTGNLDRTTAEAVGSLLLDVHREQRAVLLVVTHSDRLAERFPHRWELDDGRLVTR
ncbi:MAG: ABC transporter ATP-binding protein [Phycisphaerales bacterium]|nr:ABC transporter ATP-binding protein [Phycisphaerales bacterium]